MSGQPGLIVYFELLDDLVDFTDEEAGQILRAFLTYGATGELPCFTDRGMKAIWRKVQGWADRDSQKYERTVLQRRYASYCKKLRQEKREPLGFDDWVDEQSTADNGSLTVDNDPISPADDRQPTQTKNQTQTETKIETEASTRTRTSPGMEEEGFGEEKENPQHLTAEQLFEEKRRKAIALLQREEGQQHATF